MIKFAAYIVTALVLLTLESSLSALFSMDLFKPDLGMPFVLYITLFLGPYAGIWAALLIGLAQEVFSSAPAGSLVFTKVSVFVIATFLRNKLFIDSRYSFALACGGFVLVESVVFLALSLLAKGETKDIVNIILLAVPNSVLTGVFSIFLFSLIEYANVRFLSRE